MTGRLLTARQVADQLGLSPETVLRWARRGELPSMHLSNRAIRFRQEDIDAFLGLAERATSGKVPNDNAAPARATALVLPTQSEVR